MYAISIEENIRRILLTKKMTKVLRPEFGLSDFIDRKKDILQEMRIKEEILQNIKEYEPRIKEVLSIVFQDNLYGTIVKISYLTIYNKEGFMELAYEIS